MRRGWWLLPGPGDFVRRGADELREGRNLALALPRHLPDDVTILALRRAPGPEVGDSHSAREHPGARGHEEETWPQLTA